MIKVDTYKYIKDLHVKERKSIRQISKDVGLSRQTIRKILYDSVEEATSYKRKVSAPTPLRDQFEPIIRQWITEDLKNPPKQRHNAQRIFDRLEEEFHFTGGSSTVRAWVRAIKKDLNIDHMEAFLPLVHDPVGHAQCDWTPALARINGQEVSGDLFLLRMSFSKAFFIRFYPHQRQEAFFDAHEQAFHFFGAVPGQILYDNLKTAVRKVLIGRRREEQDSFLKFRAHHGFDSQFCNVAKGNEKGIVEGLARYVKNHIFTPVPEFLSIEALNDWLVTRCQVLNERPRGKYKVSFADLFAQEKATLLPLSKHTFDCCSRREVKANRFSLISFDKNQYSVPVDWVGHLLTIKGYVHEIRIYDKQTLLATHSRSYDTNKQYFKLEHYLKLLERKPRAVGQALPVRQTNLPAVFTNYHKEALRRYPEKGDKSFVSVLLLLKQYSIALLSNVLEKALTEGIIDIDIIQVYAENTSRNPIRESPVATVPKPNSPDNPSIAPPQINRYRQLSQGGMSA